MFDANSKEKRTIAHIAVQKNATKLFHVEKFVALSTEPMCLFWNFRRWEWMYSCKRQYCGWVNGWHRFITASLLHCHSRWYSICYFEQLFRSSCVVSSTCEIQWSREFKSHSIIAVQSCMFDFKCSRPYFHGNIMEWTPATKTYVNPLVSQTCTHTLFDSIAITASTWIKKSSNSNASSIISSYFHLSHQKNKRHHHVRERFIKNCTVEQSGRL